MVDYTNTVPEVGTPWNKEWLKTKHPDYNKNIDKWRFCRESHELSGGYEPFLNINDGEPDLSAVVGSYLMPHEKELTKDGEVQTSFWRRVANSTPPRFIQTGISTIVGALQTHEVLRSYPIRIADWSMSVDLDGSPLDTFFTRVITLFERYGKLFIFPRRNEVVANSVEELKQSGLPEVILEILSPEVVEAWEKDEWDQYLWIRYAETRESISGPTGSVKKIKRHWYFTRVGWWAVDEVETNQEPVVVSSGVWGIINYVPIIEICTDNNLTYSASLAMKDYFNVSSELQKIEKDTAFSMTWVPVDNTLTKPEKQIKGPDIVGTFPASSSHTPMVLGPDPTPFTHLMNKLNFLKQEILGCYGLQAVEDSSSGVALAFQEGVANKLYRSHSMLLEEAEYDLIKVVGDLLGSPVDINMRSSWPRDFSTLESTKILNDVKNLLSLNPGPVVRRLAVEKAVSVLLPGLTPKDKQDVLKSIPDGSEPDVEVMPVEAPAAAGGSDAEVLDPKIGSVVDTIE